MLRIPDSIGGDAITFHYVESKADLREVARFVRANRFLGIDTESTGINCYRPGWELRTVQIADGRCSYVVAGHYRRFIEWLVKQNVQWIGHNGAHDVRSLNRFLGYDSDIRCVAETYIPAHHADARGVAEGGTGHGLKELATAYVGHDAGKWEVNLKRIFKTIVIPMEGEVYKSGPRKGTQKYRKARLAEGWALVDPKHPAYIAYAAADPLLTYRLWAYFTSTVREFSDLYKADWAIEQACARLVDRGLPIDVAYTRRLSNAYLRKANEMKKVAAQYGCININSGAQIAKVLTTYGVKLTAKTPSGKLKTDDKVLRGVLTEARKHNKAEGGEMWLYIEDFLHAVMLAKQLLKRRESYTQAILRELDDKGRVHPSINSLKARTARMSVSNPPFQQLPTKDRASDE